jgi:pyridinium-3,5-bisthiocarboxylic acid mononucleotide nickel chelatase
MKKGRGASKLCALVPEGEEQRFAAIFLRETTTLGVRTAPYRRFEAARRIETFASSLGDLRVKVSEFEGRLRRTPEFEDVKALAAKHGLPAIEVQRILERELGSGEGR